MSISANTLKSACLAALFALSAVPSFGQDSIDHEFTVVAAPAAAPSALKVPTVDTLAAAPSRSTAATHRFDLIALNATFATLQGLDVHSTLRAQSRTNGRELNPVVGVLLDKPAALVAFKAASSAGLIYLSNRIAKHNHAAAVVAMIGMNCAYGFVAWHNYSLAR